MEYFYVEDQVGLNILKIFQDFCQNYNSYSVGGNLSDYKDNSILLAIGDWASYEQFGNNYTQKREVH